MGGRRRRAAGPLLAAGVLAAGLAACGQGSTPPSVEAGTSSSASPFATVAQASPPAQAPTMPGAASTTAGPAPTSSAAPEPQPRNLVDESYRGRYRITAMVLADRSHGPQLCVGGVAMSLPPQCGGPDIVGWTWDGLKAERQSGTTSGTYLVTGTFDGKRFTLTEPAKDARGGSGPPLPEPDFSTRCPAPPGGWTPRDPTRTTNDAMNALNDLANKQPGFGTLWIDQNLPPGANPDQPTDSPAPGTAPNDPLRTIINVTTTGDVAAMEKTLRTVWGGNLCVTKAPRTGAELTRIADQLQATPGLITLSPNPMVGRVDLTVVRATTQQQADLDRRYGAGLVHLVGMLVPID